MYASRTPTLFETAERRGAGEARPNRALSLYTSDPDGPPPPLVGGASEGPDAGAFTRWLLDLLSERAPAVEVRPRWVRAPGPPPGDDDLREALADVRWAARELGRLLFDRSDELWLVYPHVPVLPHAGWPGLLRMAERAFRLLALRARLSGPRVTVLIEALPIEMADGLAAAGGPGARLPRDEIRALERTLFRLAHRIVAPPGLAELVRERYGMEPDRFVTFRRHPYRPGSPVAGAGDEAAETHADARLRELGYEEGQVDFFYTGAIDRSVAPNFREVLRAVRQAPRTRLHVSGPDADAVREWLTELDVPNARHYGRLNAALHDALARRCDVGLILYPTDDPYRQRTPTLQYSAYVANGLAVLSTDLRAVAENLRADGVGRAMPIKELTLELLRWATRPKLFAEFRERAEVGGAAIRVGEGFGVLDGKFEVRSSKVEVRSSKVDGEG